MFSMKIQIVVRSHFIFSFNYQLNYLYLLICSEGLLLHNGKRRKINWTAEELQMLKVFVCGHSFPSFWNRVHHILLKPLPRVSLMFEIIPHFILIYNQ